MSRNGILLRLLGLRSAQKLSFNDELIAALWHGRDVFGRLLPAASIAQRFAQFENVLRDGLIRYYPENRGIYTQSDSPKKSSRNIWSLAVVSVDQRY